MNALEKLKSLVNKHEIEDVEVDYDFTRVGYEDKLYKKLGVKKLREYLDSGQLASTPIEGEVSLDFNKARRIKTLFELRDEFDILADEAKVQNGIIWWNQDFYIIPYWSELNTLNAKFDNVRGNMLLNLHVTFDSTCPSSISSIWFIIQEFGNHDSGLVKEKSAELDEQIKACGGIQAEYKGVALSGQYKFDVDDIDDCFNLLDMFHKEKTPAIVAWRTVYLRSSEDLITSALSAYLRKVFTRLPKEGASCEVEINPNFFGVDNYDYESSIVYGTPIRKALAEVTVERTRFLVFAVYDKEGNYSFEYEGCKMKDERSDLIEKMLQT